MDLTGQHIERFKIAGAVTPLIGLRKAVGSETGGWVPTRPMGGWLMTYGKIGPDGGVVPTVDRDGHTAEAARQLGLIDWSGYLKGRRWNDTHSDRVVGLAHTLEFHDGSTDLSKAHRKVGFWTTGHLFDRDDPQSFGDYSPTDEELAKADHFWSLAHILQGTPRPIGLSAEGLMALSKCRRRIIYAQVDQAAVCEVPVNPDATLEPMELARLLEGSPLAFLRKGMVGASPCGKCSCPPDACRGMFKAVHHAGAVPNVVPEDLEGKAADTAGPSPTERLILRIMQRFEVDRATAMRWLRLYLARRNKEASGDARSEAR